MYERERLRIDDIITVVRQNRSTWYGHAPKKGEYLGEKCMDYKVDGVRYRRRPRKTCSEVVEKDVEPNN